MGSATYERLEECGQIIATRLKPSSLEEKEEQSFSLEKKEEQSYKAVVAPELTSAGIKKK